MLNPREIEKIEINTKNDLNLTNIPDIGDINYYDLDDPKDYRKYINNIKRLVRGSIEYKDLVKHVKDKYFNNYSGLSFENEVEVKCELHHVPFTLEDIIELVYLKNKEIGISTDLIDMSREVLELHFQGIVGLYNLNRTEHEMIHNNTIFIPLQCIYGNVVKFFEIFKDYMSDYQIEVFENYQKMSKEFNNKIMNNEYFDINYFKTNLNTVDKLKELNDFLNSKINNYSLNR